VAVTLTEVFAPDGRYDALPFSRRRAAGPPSARSLLLTVLGEFALPHPDPVWTGALVGALDAVGVEEKAARQALARAAAGEGLLVAVRVGRRTRWELTADGRELLAAGARRIYGFMREQRRWDGRWLVLAVTVPETQRRLRHRLRTRLSWAGLGSPAPGLWVVPDADRGPEVAAIVAELGVVGAMSWVGQAGSIGLPADVVAAAWTSLDDVEAAYAGFVATFESRRVDDDAAAFVAQVELVQAWRRFPFIDPALPTELLDHDWPGPRAAAAFQLCHERWHRRAQAHWASLAGG
jgi:phenylacetic acid degradation operon negative regulatory protein